LGPKVPPEPMFRVELSVPDNPRVLFTVSVLLVVPPAILKPVASADSVNPFNDVAVATPNVGVTKVGELDNTTLPEPVEVVTPVPPLATGNVPVTPVVKGNPVAFVKVADEGVPKAGVTRVGDVARTTFPLPVVPVTLNAPVPPLVVTKPLVVKLDNVEIF